MGARRALLDSESADFTDPALNTFQQGARRAHAADIDIDALYSVSAYAARRAVSAPISFEPEEPLTSTRELPKISVDQPAQPSRRLKRGLLGAAAAATAGAVLVVPSALSQVTAQPDLSSIDRTSTLSRSADRLELVDPITRAQAEELAAEKAEQERAAAQAAEEKAAAEAAEKAAAEAAEKAAAEEEARAAEQAAQQAAESQSGSQAAAPAESALTAPAGGGTCAQGDGSNLGLTYQAQTAFQAICAQFPNVSSYGGWRASADDHGAGQAIDIMISGPAGWDIANWLVANSSTLGVEYVIYEQQIWGNWAPGAGFAYMEDRGGITQNHYDHVHVTIR
ncbi:MAG: hypothetical protein ACOX61_06770 [Brooklawnia sp.]